MRKVTKILVFSIFLIVLFFGIKWVFLRQEVSLKYDKLTNEFIKEAGNVSDKNLRLYFLGYGYYLKKDYLKSIYYCNELLKQNELTPKIKAATLYMLGYSNYKLQNSDEANKYADELIKSDAAKGHILKAIILKEHNKKLASAELRDALKIDEQTHTLNELRPIAVKMLEELTSEMKNE